MDYDYISSMKVEELKTYLKQRGLKITGRKVEFVARVFCAHENNVELVKTAVEIEGDLHDAYERKLNIDGVQLPGPVAMDIGWLEEEDWKCFWPMVLCPDIFNYLTFYPSELGSMDLCDYKTCKAYSYFKSGWLQELEYHSVSTDSEYCFIRGESRKSQSINDTFHKLWIAFEKKTAKIRRAHCSCMAGMGQTCNHVAAALFRIEAMVRIRLNKPFLYKPGK